MIAEALDLLNDLAPHTCPNMPGRISGSIPHVHAWNGVAGHPPAPVCIPQNELVASIKMCSDILLWTVNDFMDYFKVSAGKALDMVQTSVCVRDVVAGALKVCGTSLGMRMRARHVCRVEPLGRRGVSDVLERPYTVGGTPSPSNFWTATFFASAPSVPRGFKIYGMLTLGLVYPPAQTCHSPPADQT